MWFQYTKGNSYKRTARKRFTNSYITDCPFKLTLIYTVIGWQVKVQELIYNYKAFIYTTALPHYRQRTEEINKMITNISTSNITPSKIFTNLLKKDIIISLQNIYNKWQVNKRKLLSRLSPIQALLKALIKYKDDNLKSKYCFIYKKDNRNYFKYLFFIYLESLKYFQKNLNILLFNYIYKINKFKMPFLYIIGVNNIRQNFKLTYYFLLGKTEGNYNFAI